MRTEPTRIFFWNRSMYALLPFRFELMVSDFSLRITLWPDFCTNNSVC
jgi:hypothetical protein